MLAAHLWLLPHTHTDQLTSSVICITFGQPLIQSDLLRHVDEFYPGFRQTVHAVGLAEDNLLSAIEKLDVLITNKEVFTVCTDAFNNGLMYFCLFISIILSYR